MHLVLLHKPFRGIYYTIIDLGIIINTNTCHHGDQDNIKVSLNLTTEAISSSRERKKVVPIPCQSPEDKNHMEEANLTISKSKQHIITF
jgi:hypothetical protein